ncbi:uncharacterized protein [Setaria viridis]|uniref:Uncharacterized protein n=1 Tax=Setaria viridis TaxID=4556 RepID=A0A4U6VTK6_SETVI|nr:uncharacterized protein LOC117845941 [Setaria viridis]TKW32682.1 hypothetical protein SEVIR_2G183500v2 [Setaria viridis]
MGKGTRRNKSTAKQRRAALPAAQTTVHDLPDELVCQVLLGLGSPLDLIRAAATCVRWRRAIAGEGFLGRFYDHHGAPCVAGHYYVTDTQPPDVTGVLRWPPRKPSAAFVPSSSPDVVDGGLFSLDFLYVPPVTDRPRRTYYGRRPRRTRIRHNQCREIVDSRGSLLLLTNGPWRELVHPRHWSSDFIVCEPVSRRHQGIARPADLSHLPLLGAFLLDGGGAGGGDTMSSFRVLSVLYEPDRSRYQFGMPRACVFAPGSDGGWHICWHTMDEDVEVPLMEMIHLAGRTAGRVYWGIEDGTVLVLEESTVKFSLLTFPAQMPGPYRRTSFRVIGSSVDGEDRVRVVRVHGEDLDVFGQLLDSGEWVVEKSVALRDATAGLSGWDYRFFRLPARIVTAGNTFVVLTPAEKIWLFSVELETMEVENEHVRNRNIGPSYPCALPWPPLLRACVRRGDDDAVVGKRRQRHSKGTPV